MQEQALELLSLIEEYTYCEDIDEEMDLYDSIVEAAGGIYGHEYIEQCMERLGTPGQFINSLEQRTLDYIDV